MSEFEYKLDTLVEYTEEEILAEIRRVAALVPEGWLSRARFEPHARVGSTTVKRRFGTWQEALRRAGLGHRYAGPPPARIRAAVSARALSDEALLDEMKAVAQRVAPRLLTRKRFDAQGRFRSTALVERFGSWQRAMEAAGLEVAPTGRRSTAEELLDNLRAVWMHYGRVPTGAEMGRPPSRFSTACYRIRFGTWRRALAAFVEHAMGLGPDAIRALQPPPPKGQPAPRAEGRARPPAPPSDVEAGRSDSERQVNPRLRFAVLDRDGYRCVACGRSPAMHRGCVLHVDHIVPWSKGGATRIENLRTLCAECNQGRGNRYDGEGGDPPAERS